MSLSSTAQSMAGIRKTLAPAGIAAARAAPFATGAQQASAAQQSSLVDVPATSLELGELDKLLGGSEGAAAHDFSAQQSSAEGTADAVFGNLDITGLETLKWV